MWVPNQLFLRYTFRLLKTESQRCTHRSFASRSKYFMNWRQPRTQCRRHQNFHKVRLKMLRLEHCKKALSDVDKPVANPKSQSLGSEWRTFASASLTQPLNGTNSGVISARSSNIVAPSISIGDSSARSIGGDAAKAATLPCEPSTVGTVNPSIATLAERLDKVCALADSPRFNFRRLDRSPGSYTVRPVHPSQLTEEDARGVLVRSRRLRK